MWKYISIFKIGFAFALLLSFSACDKIDQPLKETAGQCGNENLPVPIRKILIEDFTGHKCNNCPDAAAKIEELKDLYCDYIIPVSVHAGFFAKPAEPDYPEDFRTDEGEEFRVFYKVNAFPSGLVNRKSYNENLVLPFSSWGAAVDSLLAEAPQINIILNNRFSETEQKITTDIRLDFLTTIPENLSLCLLLAEDSIVAPQLSSAGRIEDYEHNHVLRSYLNGTWGEELAFVSNKAGNQIEKNYVFDVSSDWKIENCHIIAYVYKTDSETKEIIQAESEPIIFDIK